MSLIKAIYARPIYDGQGLMTLEVDVALAGGSFGRASVPSGVAIGRRIAAIGSGSRERVVDDGMRVGKAVELINQTLSAGLADFDALDQAGVDQRMRELVGDERGAGTAPHATLAVSLAIARAAANFSAQPLYRYLGGVAADLLPIPLVQVLKGSRPTDSAPGIARLLVVPHGFARFGDALRCATEVFLRLRALLQDQGIDPTVGRASEPASGLKSNADALELVMRAIRKAGYRPGEQVRIALDLGGSERFDSETRRYRVDGRHMDAAELVVLLAEWVEKYPFWSIIDGCSPADEEGWLLLSARLGSRTQLAGDAVFANLEALASGVKSSIANSVVVRCDRVNTLYEGISIVHSARRSGYRAVLRHGTGETADTGLADLAVALRAGQVEAGPLGLNEAMVKYNQLLRIEEELGRNAVYAGAEWKPS